MEMVLNSVHGGIRGAAEGTVHASLVNREQLDGSVGGCSRDHRGIEAIPEHLGTARRTGGMSNGSEEISRVVGDFLLLFAASQVAENALLLDVPEENAVISAGGQHEGEVVVVPDQV